MNATKKTIVLLYLHLAYLVGYLLVQYRQTYKLLLIPGKAGERFRTRTVKWKLLGVFETAKQRVPAYKDFLKNNPKSNITWHGWEPDFSELPITEKENYVKKYSLEERCIDGVIPPRGVVIDESSGTSGKANNWVRGPEEREEIKRLLKLSMENIVGNEPIFIINAFALGPWATGMNVSMSLVDIAILKSVGPDIKKIENTLLTFGPKYRYVIMGYPPFLKQLVDSTSVPWSDYNCMAIFGGEGMSEGMRHYLSKAFVKVYGSYGASDLEINMGAENDFTIALRKLISENESLRQKLCLTDTSILPMIFQYNPYDYLIETNAENEIIVSVCRPSNRSPKLRYNIHDLGQVYLYSEIIEKLQEEGLKVKDEFHATGDLPLLFVYGRADASVAYYGCKITPQNIEDVIFALPELVEYTNSFALLTSEDEHANKKLTIAFESCENKPVQQLDSLYEKFFEQLQKVNQDFRESIKMVPEHLKPKLESHAYATGPFTINDIRLKKHYIQQTKE
jgi:phenylacetate-CoA ligase